MFGRTSRSEASTVTLVTVIAALGIAGLISGCQSSYDRLNQHIGGNVLTVYASMPLRGPYAQESSGIVDGEKLALEQAGGRVDGHQVNFYLRDDSSGPRGWGVTAVADNARTAVQNLTTIAYLGDLDSGASAFSIPITNEAGISQISPTASVVRLTKRVTGASRAETDKYYPAGQRSFVRVIPANDVQASAAARWMKRIGVRSAYVIDDASLAASDLRTEFRLAARRVRLGILGEAKLTPGAGYHKLVAAIAKKQPDLVCFTGGLEDHAVELWRELHAAMPKARLMGWGSLLLPQFYARLGAAAPDTYLTSAAEDPHYLPAGGRVFLRDYRRALGSPAGPYSAFGYTAMSLLLDALRRAGHNANDRGAVMRQLFATRNFRSPIGTFSIEKTGDSSLDRVAAYRVRARKLRFVATLRGNALG